MDENIQQKKWTDLLKGLGLGSNPIQFDSINDIDSVKSVGYKLNAKQFEKEFKFHTNYKDKILVVEVTKRIKS